MLQDMLLIYGGVRAMKYDLSDELWAFSFGASDSALNIPLSGAWSKVAMAGDKIGRLYGHGMALQEDTQQLWIVGGATCLVQADEDDSICAEESTEQVLKDMSTLYRVDLVKDGAEYAKDENGTMLASVQQVLTLSGDDNNVPQPRLFSAITIVADFMMVFGGMSDKAMEKTDQIWGNFDDFWGVRIVLQGESGQFRWRSLDIAGEEKPQARAGCSMILDEPYIYIFAGANIDAGELSDMWKYNLQRASPDRSTAYGDNILTATANEDSNIEIDARTLFNTPIPECSSDFVVEFQSLQTTAFILGNVIKSQEPDRCRFTVKFNIRTIGLFKMTISTQGRSISGSPSELNVLPGRTDDQMSTAVGTGLTGCTAGLTCTFTILTRDVTGNQGKGGEEVRVILTGPCTEPLEDPVTQEIQECSGPDSITATHEDSQDGSFNVAYTITATGNYSVHVKLRGSSDHIGGSPFLSLIVANSIEPSLSWVYGPGLTYSEAGLSSKFYVQTRDMFGNNISFQGADAITPIFWDDSPADSPAQSSRRQEDAAASTEVAVDSADAADASDDVTDDDRKLMQVGVRQVAKEKGLFEIIFYPFKEANGTLEVRICISMYMHLYCVLGAG